MEYGGTCPQSATMVLHHFFTLSDPFLCNIPKKPTTLISQPSLFSHFFLKDGTKITS